MNTPMAQVLTKTHILQNKNDVHDFLPPTLLPILNVKSWDRNNSREQNKCWSLLVHLQDTHAGRYGEERSVPDLRMGPHPVQGGGRAESPQERVQTVGPRSSL